MNKPCKQCNPYDTTECDACEKITKYQIYLRKKQKYRRSDTIIDTVEKLESTEFIWFARKPMHRAFIISMPFRTVMQMIRSKTLYAAELKQKPVDQQQQT